MLRLNAVLFSRSPRSRVLQDHANDARSVCADCICTWCFIVIRSGGRAPSPRFTGYNGFSGGCDPSILSRPANSFRSNAVTSSHLI
jgi:hypothetical protein